MEFDTFCDSNQEETEEWSKICYAYDFVEDKHRGGQNQVEGLMYSDIDNIHAILLTREKTLPNISALMNTLMETDAKEFQKNYCWRQWMILKRIISIQGNVFLNGKIR